MENIAQFYPMIADCVVKAVRIAIEIAFCLIIIPWLKKTAIPWMKDKQIYGLICKFVRAAEKLAQTGAISKEAKLEYVISLLERRGIHVTPDIRGMIESAVGSLDDELSHNIQELINVMEQAAETSDLSIVFDEGHVSASTENNPVDDDDFDEEVQDDDDDPEDDPA